MTQSVQPHKLSVKELKLKDWNRMNKIRLIAHLGILYTYKQLKEALNTLK